MAPYRKAPKITIRILVCDWCGSSVEWDRPGLPPGWAELKYDTNKYTPKVEPALVCCKECERRLAQSFAAGGGY